MKPFLKNYKAVVALSFLIAGLTLLPVFAQDTTTATDTTKATDEKTTISDVSSMENSSWRVTDFEPYLQSIRDLEKLNAEYSENLLNRAIDEYSTGLDILEDMEAEVQRLQNTNKDKKNLNERWYWQEVDRKNQQLRQINSLKYEAKMKSVTFFTRAINLTDDIENNEIRIRPEFVNFQIKLYQIYVSTQYDLGNFKPCIPILERYVLINDKTAKDVWAYKYLASCYGFMETMLTKYKQGSEETILNYKQAKNRSLLKAAEIKYGIDSHQYKYLKEIVERDEKKSEKINDFK